MPSAYCVQLTRDLLAIAKFLFSLALTEKAYLDKLHSSLPLNLVVEMINAFFSCS